MYETKEEARKKAKVELDTILSQVPPSTAITKRRSLSILIGVREESSYRKSKKSKIEDMMGKDGQGAGDLLLLKEATITQPNAPKLAITTSPKNKVMSKTKPSPEEVGGGALCGSTGLGSMFMFNWLNKKKAEDVNPSTLVHQGGGRRRSSVKDTQVISSIQPPDEGEIMCLRKKLASCEKEVEKAKSELDVFQQHVDRLRRAAKPMKKVEDQGE